MQVAIIPSAPDNISALFYAGAFFTEIVKLSTVQ